MLLLYLLLEFVELLLTVTDDLVTCLLKLRNIHCLGGELSLESLADAGGYLMCNRSSPLFQIS